MVKLLGHLPSSVADETSLEADQKEEMRCESLHLYYEIKDENDKNPTEVLLHIKNVHFTLH